MYGTYIEAGFPTKANTYVSTYNSTWHTMKIEVFKGKLSVIVDGTITRWSTTNTSYISSFRKYLSYGQMAFSICGSNSTSYSYIANLKMYEIVDPYRLYNKDETIYGK